MLASERLIRGWAESRVFHDGRGKRSGGEGTANGVVRGAGSGGVVWAMSGYEEREGDQDDP